MKFGNFLKNGFIDQNPVICASFVFEKPLIRRLSVSAIYVTVKKKLRLYINNLNPLLILFCYEKALAIKIKRIIMVCN